MRRDRKNQGATPEQIAAIAAMIEKGLAFLDAIGFQGREILAAMNDIMRYQETISRGCAPLDWTRTKEEIDLSAFDIGKSAIENASVERYELGKLTLRAASAAEAVQLYFIRDTLQQHLEARHGVPFKIIVRDPSF